MTVQRSTTVRNAVADVVESTIGTAPTLDLYSGTQPANCATAASGTLLATMTLPSDWLGAASSGAKALAGTWQCPSAAATGTLGYYRIVKSGTCHEQGSISMSGGGGDMIVDNTSVAITQVINITSFTLTASGA